MNRIDSAWFAGKIQESEYVSMRRFALAYGVDQSNMSRMLSGHPNHRITLKGAEKIAKLLRLDLAEVIKRSGLHLRDPQVLVEALEHYAAGPNGRRARAALAEWQK